MNGLSAVNVSIHVMSTVLIKSLRLMLSTFALLCHASYINIFLDLMSIYHFTFVLFSMGHKGSNHPKKHVPKLTPRYAQLHKAQYFNQSYEDDMEVTILEYHKYTLQNMV